MLPSLYIFLLLVLSIKIEACFYPILKFMIETLVTTTIYIYLPQIQYWCRRVVLYSGSKIYNHLPLNIKMLSKNAKQFKSKLRSYLIENTF